MAKTESTGAATSRQFRQRAGLPPRESDEPTDPAKPSELSGVEGPEGGYGGVEETEAEETSGDADSEETTPAEEPQPGADEDGFGGDAPEPEGGHPEVDQDEEQ